MARIGKPINAIPTCLFFSNVNISSLLPPTFSEVTLRSIVRPSATRQKCSASVNSSMHLKAASFVPMVQVKFY